MQVPNDVHSFFLRTLLFLYCRKEGEVCDKILAHIQRCYSRFNLNLNNQIWLCRLSPYVEPSVSRDGSNKFDILVRYTSTTINRNYTRRVYSEPTLNFIRNLITCTIQWDRHAIRTAEILVLTAFSIFPTPIYYHTGFFFFWCTKGNNVHVQVDHTVHNITPKQQLSCMEWKNQKRRETERNGNVRWRIAQQRTQHSERTRTHT